MTQRKLSPQIRLLFEDATPAGRTRMRRYYRTLRSNRMSRGHARYLFYIHMKGEWKAFDAACKLWRNGA